ncbi:MAG: hypothetical protein ACYC6X_01945 [Minisyncoccota bacterium]
MRFGLSNTIAVLALILPGAALAQFTEAIGGMAPFTLSLEPQYPAPYSQVTVTPLSDSLNLTNATVTVSINGKETYRGNAQPMTVTVGKAGSITSVVVKVSSGGSVYTKTLSIQPQDVALVIEPISSAPLLYPGKPAVPLEGSTRVVAVANLKGTSGVNLSPNTLSYAWTVDGAQVGSASGIGKEAIIVASPLQYRQRTVSVVVTSPGGSLVGGASFSLSPVEPSLQMYENDPLLGILYDHALSGGYTIAGAESTLYAAAFSFPTASGAPALQWFLNGDTAQTGNSITLRPTGSGQGTASLSLVASTNGYTMATANLSLSFGASTNSNLFGL